MAQCLSLHELRTIYAETGGRLARKRTDGHYLTTTAHTRRRRRAEDTTAPAKRPRGAVGLHSDFAGVSAASVPAVSDCLRGVEVWVLPQQHAFYKQMGLPKEFCSKEKLEEAILMCGGRVVQSVMATTSLVLSATTKQLRVRD